MEGQMQIFMSFPTFHFSEASGFCIYGNLAVKISTEGQTNKALVSPQEPSNMVFPLMKDLEQWYSTENEREK
jgi:hypothetical protein